MTTRHSAISFAAYAACCHQGREDPIGGDNASALRADMLIYGSDSEKLMGVLPTANSFDSKN